MPVVDSFNYQESSGVYRTTWTANASSGGGDIWWYVRQRGVNRDDGPYSRLKHLGTDGNIWIVQLRSEVVYATGPGGVQVPYVICRFESHREDGGGTNKENWIGIVDWDGKHWKVEPRYSTDIGSRVQFTLS